MLYLTDFLPAVILRKKKLCFGLEAKCLNNLQLVVNKMLQAKLIHVPNSVVTLFCTFKNVCQFPAHYSGIYK